ncbi:MAG: substrate-binding domain-containing protein, partial [Candidatus Zixiibacteriota bacterium]
KGERSLKASFQKRCGSWLSDLKGDAMRKIYVVLTLCFSLLGSCGGGEEGKLILATTTSVEDSGLLEHLLPVFETENTCRVKVIAVGSGQAIRLARDGNVDVILVHDRKSEEEFVKKGYGEERIEIMYNDFVLVGPQENPAGIRNEQEIVSALRRIDSLKSTFVSRADESGTHKKEKSLWASAELSPEGGWYLQSGTGMEASLRVANEKRGYCLTDRATYLSHQKELDLTILFEGDKALLNQYSVITVSPKKYPDVNHRLAQKFISFLTSDRGQILIGEFGKEKFGQRLFTPNAKRD